MRKLVLAFVAFAFSLSAPAKAEWWEAETAHFVVKARASEDDAREYALEMEKFDAALRIMFGLPRDEVEFSRANKPVIYRFGRPKDIGRIGGFPGAGILGFFIPRAGDSVAYAPIFRSRDTSAKTSWQLRGDPRARSNPRDTLTHEYTHYFMMQHFPSAYPRWYVEGFAEMMSTARFDEDGSVHIGDPPQERATQIFKIRPFAMDEMLDPDHELRGIDWVQHYATGWLLAHYMSFEPERQIKLRNYLIAVAKGEDGLEAAKREFGDLRELDRALEKYKRGPFPGRRIDGVNFDNTVKLRELSDAEEEAINTEMRLNRQPKDEGEARDIVSDFKNLVAKHPGNRHLMELLADAHLAAKQYDEADNVAQQIIAAHPKSSEAWMARSIAASRRITEDPTFAEKAREYAVEASQIDPDDPRSYMAYYFSYIESGEEVPESAAVVLEQAFKKAGSDPIYRLLLGRQLVLENRLQSAESVLLPIAFRGHKVDEPKDEEDPSLDRVITMIREKDRDGALAMIEEMMDDEEDDDADSIAIAN